MPYEYEEEHMPAMKKVKKTAKKEVPCKEKAMAMAMKAKKK